MLSLIWAVPFHQVTAGEGLAPTTWHRASYLLPADIVSALSSKVTLSGPTEKSRDDWQMEVSWLGPTVHVNLDRVGHWVTHVVVGGLAGQNGVKIRALQVLNEQRVDGLPSLLLLVTPVNQGVFSPPVQLWRRRPCRASQSDKSRTEQDF